MNQEAMKARIEKAMERYERERMMPKHRDYWSRIKHCGVRLPMRKPAMTKAPRVWCADDAR